MLKREIKALEKLIAEWDSPEALPYSSHPDFEDGVDHGCKNCADELKNFLAELKKGNK